MRRIVSILSSTGDGPISLIALEDLKTELGITGTSEDDLLQQRLDRWSEAIAEYLGRILALRDIVETFVTDTGECLKVLLLWQYPIVAIDSITINDGDPIDDYEFDMVSGRVWRLNSGTWSGRIEVTYSGGYDLPDNAPAILQWAVIEAMRQFRSFATRDPTVRQVGHGDTNVGFYSTPLVDASSGLPTSVAGAIASLRRPVMA